MDTIKPSRSVNADPSSFVMGGLHDRVTSAAKRVILLAKTINNEINTA
jgi:hypothetical protein